MPWSFTAVPASQGPRSPPSVIVVASLGFKCDEGGGEGGAGGGGGVAGSNGVAATAVVVMAGDAAEDEAEDEEDTPLESPFICNDIETSSRFVSLSHRADKEYVSSFFFFEGERLKINHFFRPLHFFLSK